MGLRVILSGTAIGSTAPLSHADFAPWASEISQLHQPRPGRMALPNGLPDRSGASVWTTLLFRRRILISYAAYYNSVRTHRSLHKDAPIFRPIQQTGIIRSHPILGGLHHHYVRV